VAQLVHLGDELPAAVAELEKAVKIDRDAPIAAVLSHLIKVIADVLKIEHEEDFGLGISGLSSASVFCNSHCKCWRVREPRPASGADQHTLIIQYRQ
jgi:hypothetical protein